LYNHQTEEIMASFTVTTNATSAGQQLAAASTAAFFGGVMDGVKLRLEASPDNTNWAPVVLSREVGGIGDNGKGVASCSLPSGWYVRVVSAAKGTTTNALVVVA
jgi:hypothetical protein